MLCYKHALQGGIQLTLAFIALIVIALGAYLRLFTSSLFSECTDCEIITAADSLSENKVGAGTEPRSFRPRGFTAD